MKAVIQLRYGSPHDAIVIGEVPMPTPGPGQVLVRIRAAAVNISDAILANMPVVVRVIARSGVTKPNVPTPGKDAAGVVEQIGPGVTSVAVGDRVFGRCSSAFAEYALADATDQLPIPHGLSFEQAAAVGISAMTALQGLRDHGRVVSGENVLVNGASGGVGAYAVQIGKALGASVTGVCSTPNVGMVGDLGADRVIDYTQADFTQDDARYDVIFDNVGNHSPKECAAVLAPGGRLLLNGGGISMGRGDGLWGSLVGPTLAARRLGQPGIMPVLKWNAEDLAILAEMLADERIRPVIDRTCTIEEAADAFEAATSGRARGKIILTFEETRA